MAIQTEPTQDKLRYIKDRNCLKADFDSEEILLVFKSYGDMNFTITKADEGIFRVWGWTLFQKECRTFETLEEAMKFVDFQNFYQLINKEEF